MACPNCGAPGGGVTGCSSCGLGKDPNVGGAFNAGQTEMKIQEDRKRNSGGPDGCFAKLTKVLTTSGWLPIATLAKDMEVVSFDVTKQELSPQPILAVKAYSKRKIWEVEVAGVARPIETTWCHPFFVNGAWKWTSWINSGDRLLDVSSEFKLSEKIVQSVHRTDRREDVFNLVTRGPNNFFVEGALVHNFGILRKTRGRMLGKLANQPIVGEVSVLTPS